MGEGGKKGWNIGWDFFAAGPGGAVNDARLFETRIGTLKSKWRERLQRVRRGSATDLLVEVLPGAPVITARSAAKLIGRSFPAANEAIGDLVGAGVLRQGNGCRRNRAFEAAGDAEALHVLQRVPATPAG